MKKLVCILLLVSSLCIAQSKEKKVDPGDKQWYGLDKIAVRIENNFFKRMTSVTNPYTDLSHREDYYNAYGGKINLKITKTLSMIVGTVGIDTLKANKDLYKIENLEVEIIKNNKIERDWVLVTKTKSFSANYIYEEKQYTEKGYFPYTDSLVDGDKLLFSFRKKGQKPFLKLHIEKKASARKPFHTIALSNDLEKTISFEKFIQESIERVDTIRSFHNPNFDSTWPEDFAPRTIGIGNRHFKGEMYCLIFRRYVGKKRTNDSFEYRNTINSKAGAWIKSNGIIFLNLNESGTHYKLEVRYKNDPKNVAVYYYSTEPDWYQTLWFKIVVSLLSLLIFSVGYFLWMRKMAERKRLEQKSKIKMLYAQLNPHFVFNALGSIQGLLNDNQIEKANQYLTGFGSLLRNTLASSENDLQSLEIEIKSISNYIELEQLRNPFLYRLTIDEKINVYEVQTLPLLIQPLIENAIKHGISNKENAEITLTISKKADDLIFELADNGKGFDTLAEQKGFGLKLVKDRITLFNQSSKKAKIEMKIQSSLSGTQISIYYKNWLKND